MRATAASKGVNGTGRVEAIEVQGATSWSSDDLRVKYRAEKEREEAYQASRLQDGVAEALVRDFGKVGCVHRVL